MLNRVLKVMDLHVNQSCLVVLLLQKLQSDSARSGPVAIVEECGKVE